MRVFPMKTRSHRGFFQEKQTNNQQRQMCWLPASPGRCSGSPTSQTPAASGCAACTQELMGKLPSSPPSKEVAACDARDGTSLGKGFATGTCTSTSLGDGGSSEDKSHGGSKVPFSPVPYFSRGLWGCTDPSGESISGAVPHLAMPAGGAGVCLLFPSVPAVMPSLDTWRAPALAISSPSCCTRRTGKILCSNHLSCALLCLFVS